MPPPICNDHLFGPVVSGCSGRTFDFTRTFEDIFLSLVPNTLFLITALVRIGYLVRQVRVANGLLCQLLKLVSSDHPWLQLAVSLKSDTKFCLGPRAVAAVSGPRTCHLADYQAG